MYWGVAHTDSELVFLELASDGGRRSLANESASLGSTSGASLASTTFESPRSVSKPGLGIARLLHLSESPRAHSLHCPSPLRQSALTEGCPRDIVDYEAPIAHQSARASAPPLHVEFSIAGTDQEAG
jgi:hypothetical protein